MRTEKVCQLRRMIQSGAYPTVEVTRVAVGRLIAGLAAAGRGIVRECDSAPAVFSSDMNPPFPSGSSSRLRVAPKDPEPVEGGQGRSEDDVNASAGILLGLAISAVVWGCVYILGRIAFSVM